MVRHKTFYKFFISILLFSFSSNANAIEPLRLQVFVSQVMEANPNLQAARLRAEAFKFRIKPAGSLDDPVFAVGPDDLPLNGGGGSVIRYQINQILPFPGKPHVRSQIAKAKAQVVEADSETTRRQLTVFATQTFYKAYYNQEALKFNLEIQKLIRALVETGKSRYITGGATHHEWLLAKAELGVLEVDQLRLIRGKKALQALLNELRNLDPQIPLGTLIVRFSQEKKIEMPDTSLVIENQPEKKSLGYLAEAAKREKDLAKMDYHPDFMVQGMFTQRRGMEDPSTWGLMVGMNLPLWGYRKQSQLIAAAQKDKEAALAEQKSLENKLKTELTEAEQQFLTARDIVKLYRSSVIPETRLALSSAQAAYATGNSSLASILNLARIRRTQELELLAAKIDLELAQLRVQELLSSPPIERFAPSSPTLFNTDMGTLSGTGMSVPGNSGAGMGGKGMSGPAARPQKMGQEKKSDAGMGGGM